jgi:hypothetical protein
LFRATSPKAEGITLVRESRESGNQILGFATRPFMLCGLPVQATTSVGSGLRTTKRALSSSRSPAILNSACRLDRTLVPIFLSNLAVRQQSQTFRFKSAAQMLDTFGMAKGGKEYRRLVAAFERIFGATTFFATDSVRGGARVVNRCRF